MSSVRSVFGRVRSALELFGSAVRVAQAVQSDARPDPRDLRRCGIDPMAFTTIGHG